MSIPLGTNDLKIYRRHVSHCTRYPALKNKPDTYRPITKKDQKLDNCLCPIWCRGYLAKETKVVKGKLRSKRIFASLDTSDWAAAERAVAACTSEVPCRRSNQPPGLSTTVRSRCGTPPNDTSSLAEMDR